MRCKLYALHTWGAKPSYNHTVLVAGMSSSTNKWAQFTLSSQLTHTIHWSNIIQHCDGASAGSPIVGCSSYGVQAGTYKVYIANSAHIPALDTSDTCKVMPLNWIELFMPCINHSIRAMIHQSNMQLHGLSLIAVSCIPSQVTAAPWR